MRSDPKVILKSAGVTNVPIGHLENVPIAREYVRSTEVQELAVQRYYTNGKGITFNDLILRGISKSKPQAQRKIKNCLKNQVLFTIQDHKPQQYYPTCLKAHILQRKNVLIHPTGIHYSHYYHQYQYNNTSSCLQDYILPLLTTTPSHIHNLHFKLKLTPQCYLQLSLPQYNNNKGKHHHENIGSVYVLYTFYPNGTVEVAAKCTSNPFRLSNNTDLACLLAFLGQLRDRLILLLADVKEKIVPDITEWYLRQLDINKDIEVSPSLHFTVPNTQVKHFDDVFRIYIKSMEEHTVCRVEKSIHPPAQQSPIEVLNDIFNSAGEQQ
jgi:hypothetical protein